MKKKRKTTRRGSRIHNSATWVLVVLLSGVFSIGVFGGFSRAGNVGGAILNQHTWNVQPKPMIVAKAQQIYYENTVKNIIQTNCGRCHSGPTRNLMDYDSLKAYADSGLLATMVQGPMARFAGQDQQTILAWINQGAPEKPGTAPAGFFTRPHRAWGMTGQAFTPEVPMNNITYGNTIKFVLAKDCLHCHSGPFRNLTTYENVKFYVDNGLMESLVQRGGPMHRFAGPDARLIVNWIDNGAPQ